ncbi:MAG: hypothetical protein HY075_09515 [Deltaproteobacteria bacterium]|nr:hypothetical protein [Deltaproteobacteria bacterium]
MNKWISVALLIVGLTAAAAKPAGAVQLDWSGQFWFDNNWLNDYQLSRSRPGYDNDPVYSSAGGPYVGGAGEKNVVWYEAFLRLKPKLVVNDSLNIKSELQIGSPAFGFMGRGYPGSGDEKFNFTGSQKDGFSITAQRFWANLITDFGTIELGRAPRHWGLGAIWNSGDALFDRFQSTGDMIRLTSKFGNFSISPALVKVALGNNVAGAQDAAGNVIQGNDDVTDYELAVKYDNSEEDFEFGMMWTKRNGNTAQRSILFNRTGLGSTRINFNIFDFYSRKKWGHFWIGGELPLFNGSLGALDGQNEFDYKTFALLFEGGYTSDLWDIGLKAGHVPGEQPTQLGDTKFRAIYLNKDYKLGLVMFNYNLYGLTNNNPDTVSSANLNNPYDNQIVNANYVALNPQLKLDKWTLKSTLVFAFASEVAQSGSRFYNYSRRQFFNARDNQSSFLGWEGDLGVGFRWDENISVGWDVGFWFPGAYYSFANLPGVAKLDTDMMFASQVKVGVTF